MRRKNRLISSVLCIILVLSTVTFASAEGSGDVKRMFLLEKGIPQEYLNVLDEGELSELYEKYQNENVFFGGFEKETLTFDESTGSMQRGTISNADMTMYIMKTVNVSSTTTKKISSVDVDFTWEWDTGAPAIRGTDAIAANWDGDVFSYKPASMRCEAKYREVSPPIGEMAYPTTYQTVTSLSAANQGGIGWDINLKKDTNTMMGKGEFTLLPRETMYWNQTEGETNVSINVIYGHNIIPVGSISLTITPGVSVTITPSATVDSKAVTTLVGYDRS